MAFLEWRRIPFFDLQDNVDEGKIAEALKDTEISIATSGNSHVVLCDTTGWCHLINKSWDINSFKAYELTNTLAQQYHHDPFLVTVGDDEPGTNPMIKVWDWSRNDRHGNPICVRVTRAVPSHMKPTPATALAIHESKTILAVGFNDGSVTLFRGDITRQRSGKMKTLSDTGNNIITGLAFKGKDELFIVSRSTVMVYWLTSERCMSLDTMGAMPGCAVLGDRHQLMIATKPAIYCYTAEGRGPCYALEGDKKRLDWFRNYLVITTNEYNTSSNNKTNNLTILDIQNKFIVFTKSFEEIDTVITEWGSFYVLTKNKELIYLKEKDLQSKLSLLFKKNLYDIAIRIAPSHEYGQEGLSGIYKQYGDHLYTKGDLKGAIDQYVKTIGYLETSYVIRKYLESRHLEPLIYYLEELHKQGYATEDHTTLLLTCYVKLDQHDQKGKLGEFINSKDKIINFDVDVAIKVVRQVSPDDALTLAAQNERHDSWLRITIEDKQDYNAGVNYISDLKYDDARTYLSKYGHALIQHEPEETTELLKLICTDYKPRSAPLVEESALSGVAPDPDRSSPDEYIHLFLNNSERLIEFLEHVVAYRNVVCSKLVYNALIEHYIHVWSKLPTENEKLTYENKIMKVLRDAESNYDKDHVLILSQMLNFKPGILYLYEENKLWRAALSVHLREGLGESAMRVCRSRGAACPQLWLDVLWHPPPPELLPELLNVIDNEKLLSPILVIDSLANTQSYTLGHVRKYLTNVLKCEEDTITRSRELANKYREESANMKRHIHMLQHEPVTFQGSKCAACNRSLELPTVYFLCQHSYHQHCFESYSEGEGDGECVICASPARPAPPPAETLHDRLHREGDPYDVVAEYFGRGLFNKITVVTEGGSELITDTIQAPPAPKPAAPATFEAPTYGPGAEAKMRLTEGRSRQLHVGSSTSKQSPTAGSGVVPVPEGRMRLLEQHQYSTSLEANMSRLPEPVHMRPSPHLSPATQRKQNTELSSSPNISSSIANTGANPFGEDDDYDESKNPFADDDDYDDSKNPFADEEDNAKNPFGEDDYDKNLNPFS